MIAHRCELIEIAANEIIYKENDDIGHFFLIIDGKRKWNIHFSSLHSKKFSCLGCVVAKKEGAKSEKEKKFIKGEFFGLTPFFFGGKAKATLTAASHSICLFMEKKSIEEIIVPIIREIEKISQSYGDFINCLWYQWLYFF